MGLTEFQAVIMAAGKGSRMTELTARKAKCLLPVANLPLVWFPINLVERSGFQEVIIVVLESVKSEIQAVLDKCGFKVKIELFGISGEDLGTADSLRCLQEANKIKSDLVVVSCDLISDVNLAPLFDIYRKHDATLAALFVKQNNPSQSLPTPGPKSKDKTERDFVGVTGSTSRLVFVASASDYEEVLPMSQKMLHRYGKVNLHSRLLDAHVYIMNKWLCQYLTHNRSLSTIKGELLPHVVRKHLSEGVKQKPEQDKASIIAVDEKTDICQFAQESDLTNRIRMMSTYTDERCKPVYNNDTIRCYAVIENNAFAVRANTLQSYCRINREVAILILERWSGLICKELVNITPSAVIKSTQLDKDTCIVGEKAQIAEKTSLKNSVIGPNVIISPKTRVMNSVIMHGAKVGEGCNIQNSIICEESETQDGCELKDCLVGSHHTVTAGGKHSNEVLTDIDRLMEI